jgi:hypothetical protein
VDTGLGYPPEFASAVHQTDTFGALTSGSFARVEPAAIRDIGVFAEFDDEQCEQVAGACQELDVDAGTKLTEEGDFGYAMFAVLEGTADVSRNGDTSVRSGPVTYSERSRCSSGASGRRR